ncbi:hypothetical protein [Demequina litorisediminis]|uniref:hypothetical protein n=1 Tax=Demequina litorisediminis TaxID=1849022 RepID=UPI0024E147EF|nr:hypothetical protein [Demequina litorisediminis]
MTTTNHDARIHTMPGLSVHEGYLPTPMTRLTRLFPDSDVGLYAKLDQPAGVRQHQGAHRKIPARRP